MTSDKKKNLRILIIEDDVVDRKMLERHLSKSSLEIEKIESAELLSEAVESLRAERFDIILSDLGLPDSNGLSAVRDLQAVAPDVPLIVLSGLSDESAAMKAVEQGAKNYLLKDKVSCESLEIAIQHAIQGEYTESHLLHNIL